MSDTIVKVAAKEIEVTETKNIVTKEVFTLEQIDKNIQSLQETISRLEAQIALWRVRKQEAIKLGVV